MAFFRRKAKPDPSGYYNTGIDAADVKEGSLVTTAIDNRKVVLTRACGNLVAFSAVCPHAAADLGRGRTFRDQVKCPEHGYTYNLCHGRATWPENEGSRLTRFKAKVGENGCVYVRWT